MRTLTQFLITFLLNASWQIVPIVVAAMVGDKILRGTEARYRHALWVSTLFLAFFLPLGISLKTVMSYQSTSLVQSEIEMVQSEIEMTPMRITVTDSAEAIPIEVDESRTAVAAAVAEPEQRHLISPILLSQNLASVLIVVYAGFFIFGSFRLFRAWLRTRRIVKDAYPFELSNGVEKTLELCERLIGRWRALIYTSNSIPLPLTVGIFNPLIVLPESLLHETDDDILTAAIGHELIHVARRDYLANLIYEFLYIPLWFHPATAFVMRRIRQTREACCDESVTTVLLKPEVYAQSLVRLLGSSPAARRAAAVTTIGITERDNLEVRIMSLLRKRTTPKHKMLLIVVSSLLLASPCVASAKLALTFDLAAQELMNTPKERSREERPAQEQERMTAKLKRLESSLKEQIQNVTGPQREDAEKRLLEVQQNLAEFELRRPNIENRLLEVQQNLAEHERITENYYRQKLTQEENLRDLMVLREAVASMESRLPADQKLLEETKEKLAEAENRYAEIQRAEETDQSDRSAWIVYRAHPAYPADAKEKGIRGIVLLSATVERDGTLQNIQLKNSLYPSLDEAALEAARKMRWVPALKNGQPVPQTVSIEFYFSPDSPPAGSQVWREDIRGVTETRRPKEQTSVAQDERTRRQSELARGAVISMDQAIQIATSKYRGKVLACSLGRDKDGPVFYHLLLINTDGDKPTVTYVWLSAIDGTILKTQDEATKVGLRDGLIEGDVLNRKAVSLPEPTYTEIARVAHTHRVL